MSRSSEPDLADLSKRMDGALEVLRKEFAGPAHRPGQRQPARADLGRGLRRRDAAQPGRHDQRARAAHADRPGLGPGLGQGGREGDPQRSTWASTRRSTAQLLRVPLPELSQERRNELAKVAHRYAEQARVAVRNVRRDGMDQLKRLEKDGDISQDEHKQWSDEVQELTDRHIEADQRPAGDTRKRTSCTV